mmetsp:Transcript_81495/g.218005  ORF Transcript_81495/g.218005 Transcript_81495/m.218005 type:complete len:147 (+) Transcript_81495:1048-1488(+)
MPVDQVTPGGALRLGGQLWGASKDAERHKELKKKLDNIGSTLKKTGKDFNEYKKMQQTHNSTMEQMQRDKAQSDQQFQERILTTADRVGRVMGRVEAALEPKARSPVPVPLTYSGGAFSGNNSLMLRYNRNTWDDYFASYSPPPTR